MNFVITGATGTVGSILVNNLLHNQENVTVLMRNPGKKNFPDHVTKVQGDLSNALTWKDCLKEIDGLFLLLTPDGDPAIIQYAEEAKVKHIVALSDGTKYPTEEALYQSKLNWTMLFPVEFMKNTLVFWQESIRTQRIARTPFPDAKGALIHEADIAEVAEIVLCNAGHEKKSYYLTGAEISTPRLRIQAIAKAIHTPVQMIIQTEEEARTEYAGWGFSDALIDYAIESSKHPEPYMYTVLPTVFELTGHPARSFEQWTQEHAADFV